MRATRLMFLSAGTALLLGLGAPASADEKSHKGQTMSMDEMMKGCQEQHASEMKARDETAAALTRAKQADSLDEMRKGIEQAEKSLDEMKNHMSMCMGMIDGMEGTHAKMMGSGTMGSMMSGEKKAVQKVTDPVCGMEVDPKTAPSATYKGKTYYFCGPEDKAKFVKDPENYVKKKLA